MARKTGTNTIAENRRARYDYNLLDRVEAGLVLTGTEVKSLRDGRVTLDHSYADLRDGEVWLIGAHIDEYAQGNVANHEPNRDRKLLLKRREIESLTGQVQQKGLTIVPTRLYWKNGRAKLELAVARGKERIDKRRDIAKRETQRDIDRALRRRPEP
ncbi:MAG: SsrA-binding protein SmpB [Actinomycetota bacterium]|nr:SsrA-binding protein SmpB [Actinomycetota bacterium]